MNLFLCNVIPKTEYASQSPYVKITTKSYGKPRMIPLEKEAWLTQDEIRAIEGIHDITSKKEKMSIADIMKKYQVTEELANQMANEKNMNTKLKRKYHYKVVIISKTPKSEKDIRDEIAKDKDAKDKKGFFK
jgi:predicted RND superfamily exporter protein